MVFQHTFYGESLPFGKNSYKHAETLGYLNSQQTLADFAVLIRSLKQNLSSEASPVVVFGGSYGGSKLKTLLFLLMLPQFALLYFLMIEWCFGQFVWYEDIFVSET